MRAGTMTSLAAINAAQDANDTVRMMKHSLSPFGQRHGSTAMENPKLLLPNRPDWSLPVRSARRRFHDLVRQAVCRLLR